MPRSISRQLLVVWLLAMLAAHGIAILMMSWWRADNLSIHPLSARMMETRIVAAYRLAIAAGDNGTVLESINLPDSKFRLMQGPVIESPMDSKEQQLAGELRKLLDLPSDTLINVRLEQKKLNSGMADRRNWLEGAFGRPYTLDLRFDVGLPDGRILASDHRPTIIPAHWSRVLTFSLLVGMIPTMLIAMFFGGQIMRPLMKLTDAANRVSRGEEVILPPVKGPDGVREITDAFNAMQRNLTRFVHQRTMVVAAIGHDLRTPMTSLRIRAELVEDADVRQAMIRTLDDMRVMVDEILKFAKDDALQEPTVQVGLNSLVSEAISEQRMLGKDITFVTQLSDGYAYRCRPVHLKRALSNLIDNAARFGPVTVEVQMDSKQQRIHVKVLDQGPGIATDRLDRVFEPFFRLDASRSSATGGAGLGLTIAHSCARAHGGSIVLSNRNEGGLCALIDLPI